MRLESFRAKHIGPFADFNVDFVALGDAALIAVTGPNGAGKSTLLELATGGAAYRTCETRGSLGALATERDAQLEVRLVNGASWTIRHTVDAVSGKGETVVLGADGAPAYDSTKVTDFDSWSAEHLPPPELLYSSTVAVQGALGFVDLKPGERKGVVLRLLGVERLEAMAKDARASADAVDRRVEKLSALIAAERDRGGDPAKAQAELDAAREAAAEAERAAAASRAELNAAVAEAARSESAGQAYRVALAARKRAEDELRGASEKLSDIERRTANNRAVLAEADSIRDAVARMAQLETEAAEARQMAAMAEQDATAAWSEVSTNEGAMGACLARVASAQERAKRARARAADLDAVRAAVADLPALRSEADHLRAEATSAEQALEELRGRRLAGADERIDGLRRGLTHVADGDLDDILEAVQVAQDTLSEDDERVHLAEETTALVRYAIHRRGRAHGAADVAARRLTKTEALAARLPDVESAVTDIETAEREIEQATNEANKHRADAKEATAKAEQLRDLAHSIGTHEVNRITLGIEQHERMAAKLKPLENAEARLAELEPQAAEWRATVERLEAEIDAQPPPTRPSEPPPTAPLATALAAHEDRHRRLLAGVTRAEETKSQASESKARIDELEDTRATDALELADWNRLASDLGRNGLQAALIDGALGEITELCNHLLHDAFGPRWTVRFDTQRQDSTGKKQVEGLFVVVIDTERGREALVETYSGGEKTILAEAVSLALTALACRRSGMEDVTLVRDESGAALDPDKAVAYVEMLRAGVRMVGARQCLLVSHSPEVQALCDARIEL